MNLSTPLNELDASKKPKPLTSGRSLDLQHEYYRDYVFIREPSGKLSVTDAEGFHADRIRIYFSGDTFEECAQFVDDNFVRRTGLLLRALSKMTSARKAQTSNVKVPGGELLKSIEFAGWLKPFAESKVGTHPVFNFINHPPPGFTFTKDGNNRYWNPMMAFRIFSVARTICVYSFRFWRAGVPLTFILKFWLTRGISLKNLKIKPGAKSVVLYPTYLFFCPNHSWMVEIEDMLTLMEPFVSNGSSNPSLGPTHPIAKVLGVLFASKECVGVICHLSSTANGLKQIFKDRPEILPKIKHIPLGMPVPPRTERYAGAKEKTINILYINGWSQDKRATYRRGLLDALKSFSLIMNEFENVRLIVRSQLPELSQEYLDILANPKVTLIEEKVHQSKLQQMYRDSDILLFPAARIAVTTLLQAMANSLAIVASDGFGIEEYIDDGSNGLVARGFNGRSGWIDQNGFCRENWILSLKCNASVSENAAKHLRSLIQDKALLLQMQNGARESLEQRFSIDAWNKEFGPFLSKALQNL